MSRKSVKHSIFSSVVFLLIIMISGCGNFIIIPEQPQLLLKRSKTQTLIIKNTHGVPLTILGCEKDDPVITIPIDGEANLKFSVVVVVDLKRPSSWRPKWFEMAGTSLIYAEPVNGPCHLKPGPDSIIMLNSQQPGKGNEIRLNFQNCETGRGWKDVVAPAANHFIDSSQIAGMPVRICPSVIR